ncbi:thiamine pyrophosphate-binding protein [Aliivibrio fischeri]|uniref:thiamine pyrophosphate-binding protein n=1 Tax=Aliivibrio fischeri TaxID=668 RepID=UPI0007C48AC1|nr:thiamine pyrophosphate-binding protein [Aliivibrio fischeri]
MFFCTKEINAKIVISLLKSHGIKNIIASPGATNVALIGSIQNDPFFNIYSAVDERSAAYMACGLADESGEPVVLSCTGATASRNYLPGLTEAFYRKLPVLAITSTQSISKIGHLEAQVIDRSSIQNDVAKLSVTLPIVKDADDEWECEIKTNNAILELNRNGGGPVHINLQTIYDGFENTELTSYRIINRITYDDVFPELIGKVAILIGSHKKLNDLEVNAIDKFCLSNSAVVFCDHTSNYYGKYRVTLSLVASQVFLNKNKIIPDTLIHIGEISGDYPLLNMPWRNVWRVNVDGNLVDKFKKLRYVFEMNESDFFEKYSNKKEEYNSEYLSNCISILDGIRSNIPVLPFSNIWVASILASKLPENSILHLGILNSLRSWNLFEITKGVSSMSNVGGFGIDGIISSLLGASLNNSNKLCFCVLGDLAFFYDLNTLGNRHIGNNIRILIINNGVGTEFKQYNHHASLFKNKANDFIAAAEHFGNKSEFLVKNFSENLGFEYISASNKEQFNRVYSKFISEEPNEKPIIFEVFTNSEDESEALKIIHHIHQDSDVKFKKVAKSLVSNNVKKNIKKILGK